MTEPTVDAIITPITVIFEIVVANPPKVKITSDGIGGNKFSIVINDTIPKYPNLFIISIIAVCIISSFFLVIHMN